MNVRVFGVILLVVLCVRWQAMASLTDKQKKIVLMEHNSFRSQLTPRASNMLKLTWDKSLADRAQAWADSCSEGHNPVTSNDQFEWIGENLAFSTDSDPKGMVRLWEGEKKIFDFRSNRCNPDPGNPLLAACGHYTQMVWADTMLIGCGFKKKCPGYLPNRLVCNYGEGGNWVGEKPYKTATECSQCPEGYPQCKNNLCVRG